MPAARSRSSREIRDTSRRDVVRTIVRQGSSTRIEIARANGLSAATVSSVITELRGSGLVTHAGTDVAGPGRRSNVVAVDGAAGTLLGVDIDETHIRAVVFDASMVQIAAAEVVTDDSWRSAARSTDIAIDTVERALGDSARSATDLLGVGVGVGVLPGGLESPVGAWSGRVRHLASVIRTMTTAPVVVANPLEAVALSEVWFGAARDRATAVVITLGIGVGAGIVLDGRVVRGATHHAGEWGHTTLVLDGRACRCGRHGCVEAYVGVRGIRRTLGEIDPGSALLHLTQHEFVRGLRDSRGDPAVTETLRLTARYLGVALSNVVAVLDPDVLTLTGSTAWMLEDALMPATRAALAERSPDAATSHLRLEVSPVRADSVATGMAVLALERHLDSLAPSRRTDREEPWPSVRSPITGRGAHPQPSEGSPWFSPAPPARRWAGTAGTASARR